MIHIPTSECSISHSGLLWLATPFHLAPDGVAQVSCGGGESLRLSTPCRYGIGTLGMVRLAGGTSIGLSDTRDSPLGWTGWCSYVFAGVIRIYCSPRTRQCHRLTRRQFWERVSAVSPKVGIAFLTGRLVMPGGHPELVLVVLRPVATCDACQLEAVFVFDVFGASAKAGHRAE